MSSMDLASLSNPLATLAQLSSSSTQLDGLSSDLEDSIRFAGIQLTQAAGILLRLPQEIIAQAIVIFTRFYTGPEGGSFVVHSAKDVSAASIYMMSKISALPQTPRSILNVYAYLCSKNSFLSVAPPNGNFSVPNQVTYYLSEGAYMSSRMTLLQTEAMILRALSFITKVVTPHHLVLTLLQTLGALPTSPTSRSRALAVRTIAHLNTALLSPQLLYLTHQPIPLAVAAIYLAAKETGVKLPSNEWWEVFDVDREELGFLVVGLGSCEGWADEETQRWSSERCPLTVDELKQEMSRSNIPPD